MPDNNNKVVDVHHHVISPNLAKAIADCVPIPDILKRERVVTEEEQLEAAEKNGIDTLWFSFRTIKYYVREKEFSAYSPHSLTVARTVNDYMATVCQRYPGRFMAFADVSLAHGEAAIKEMVRALKDLGLHGILLQTNYDGKPLDAPEFRPFFEEANRLRVVIHLHPIAPLGADTVLRDYSMGMILGFPSDTTLSMVRLAYSGMLEQYPDLTFILSHAGGLIPFIWWRINMPYSGDRPGTRDNIKAPPTDYLKRCYYDTALSDTESLMLTHKRVGDHLMFGTDNPYGPKDGVEHTFRTVNGMDIPDETKAKIMSGNALALANRSGS